MVDLNVEMAGIKLKNPLVVGAGPNTKNLPSVVKCIKAGFGAVVVRSLHVQHLNETKPPLRGFWYVYANNKNYTKTLYSFQSTSAPAQRPKSKIAPGFGGAARFPSLDEWTEEVYKMKQIAREYDCAIIASLGWCGSNLADEERWKAEARAMTEASVDALQLHTGPSPATEPGRYMTIDPKKHLEMPIKAAKEASNLPVFAKLPVDCCDTIGMAGIAQKAGADGVVPSTRWVSLSIDIEHETESVDRGPGLGGPWSAPIMNGLVYRMRHATYPVGYPYGGTIHEFPDATPVTVPIVASGGVRSGADVMGYIIAGANAAEICSQVLVEGVQVARRIEKEIRNWMKRKGYQKISDLQGILKLLAPSESKNIPQWTPVVDENRCNACKRCIETCPNEAISLANNIAHIDDDYCEGCRTCYYVCPTGAMSLKAYKTGVRIAL